MMIGDDLVAKLRHEFDVTGEDVRLSALLRDADLSPLELARVINVHGMVGRQRGYPRSVRGLIRELPAMAASWEALTAAVLVEHDWLIEHAGLTSQQAFARIVDECNDVPNIEVAIKAAPHLRDQMIGRLEEFSSAPDDSADASCDDDVLVHVAASGRGDRGLRMWERGIVTLAGLAIMFSGWFGFTSAAKVAEDQAALATERQQLLEDEQDFNFFCETELACVEAERLELQSRILQFRQAVQRITRIALVTQLQAEKNNDDWDRTRAEAAVVLAMASELIATAELEDDEFFAMFRKRTQDVLEYLREISDPPAEP